MDCSKPVARTQTHRIVRTYLLPRTMAEPDFDSLSPEQICGQLEGFFRRLILEGTRAKLPEIEDRGKIYTEIPTLNIADFREDIIQRITQAAKTAGYRVIRVNFEKWGCNEKEGFYFLFETPKDHDKLVREYAQQRLTLLGRHDLDGIGNAEEKLTRYLMYKWDQLANTPTPAGQQATDHVVLSAGGVDTFYVDSRRGTVDELDQSEGAEPYHRQRCCYVRITSGQLNYSVSYQSLLTRWEVSLCNFLGQQANDLSTSLPFVLPPKQRRILLKEFRRLPSGASLSTLLELNKLSAAKAASYKDNHRNPAKSSSKGKSSHHGKDSVREVRPPSRQRVPSGSSSSSKRRRDDSPERNDGHKKTRVSRVEKKLSKGPEKVEASSANSDPSPTSDHVVVESAASPDKSAAPVATVSVSNPQPTIAPLMSKHTMPALTTTTTATTTPVTFPTGPLTKLNDPTSQSTSSTPVLPTTIKEHVSKETISTTLESPRSVTKKDTIKKTRTQYTKEDASGSIKRTTEASEDTQVTSKQDSIVKKQINQGVMDKPKDSGSKETNRKTKKSDTNTPRHKVVKPTKTTSQSTTTRPRRTTTPNLPQPAIPSQPIHHTGDSSSDESPDIGPGGRHLLDAIQPAVPNRNEVLNEAHLVDYEPDPEIVHEVVAVVESEEEEWSKEDQLKLLRDMERKKRQIQRARKISKAKEGKSRRVPPC